MSSRLALAMSASALVVALVGSTPIGHALVSNVPRNSVGPLQLKRNAVTARKLSPNAVRTGHVLDGSLLAADFKAGQIPAGPKGDKGDQGPPGASELQTVIDDSATDSNTLKAGTAFCPSGKRVLGGGATVTPNNITVAIVQTIPAGTNAWLARAYETVATPTAWKLTVYAICAKVT